MQKRFKQLWTKWLAVRLYPAIALLALSGLLSACAMKLPGSTAVQPPVIPAPPASLMKPVSPASYSEAAQKNMEAWQQQLTNSETK